MSLRRSKILKSILVVVPVGLSFTKDTLGRYAKEILVAMVHGNFHWLLLAESSRPGDKVARGCC